MHAHDIVVGSQHTLTPSTLYSSLLIIYALICHNRPIMCQQRNACRYRSRVVFNIHIKQNKEAEKKKRNGENDHLFNNQQYERLHDYMHIL